MKTNFYLNGKKISKKTAEAYLGKKYRINGSKMIKERIAEAKEIYYEDSLTMISWPDGLEIRFC